MPWQEHEKEEGANHITSRKQRIGKGEEEGSQYPFKGTPPSVKKLPTRYLLLNILLSPNNTLGWQPRL
jgi:hypothetical protein